MIHLKTAFLLAYFSQFVACFNFISQIFDLERNARIISSGTPIKKIKVNSEIECAVICSNTYKCCSSNYDMYIEQCTLFMECSPKSQQAQESQILMKTHTPDINPQPKDCSELPPGTSSGVYDITPANESTISVFCEMDTDNGGWTTIQRRYDGTVDFYRFWDDYKAGFGEIAGEHWLGNSYLHAILRQRSYQVRFDVEDFSGNTAYAIYNAIYVGDEKNNFKLSLTGYTGTAGNAMVDRDGTPMNGMMFTTRDRDNDISTDNCGNIKKSGWWHAACTWANLNGGVYTDEILIKSIHWITWKQKGLKGTRIMIKPQPSF